MKKTNLYILLAVGAFGVMVFSTKIATAQSCCMGGMTATLANEVSTNAVPDLLPTCPVSGDKLGEMGKPFTFTYQGQEVKLCCGGCKKDFDKDPAKYVAKIRAADKK
jgi:YHS domain-containing protein